MRKLKLHINDKDYTLELTRESIKWLESNGFEFDKFESKPVTYYDLLWQSLFIANHRDVNSNLAIKLMNSYKDSGHKVASVIKFAIDEYNAFMNALIDIDSTKTDEKLEITEE